jgi:hypothetical protein
VLENSGVILGGEIDKVRELPYPHFSKYNVPYVKGRKIDVTTSPTKFTDSFTLPFNVEYLSIAMSCSAYGLGDYWELFIGNVRICEQIYTKELPESVSMGNSFGIVYPVNSNVTFKFDFYNVSGIAKQVWYNMKFLRQNP